MYYILHFYNKVSWRKENLTEKVIRRENTFMVFTRGEKIHI